jgi:glycosyltransferase involved in cell wall biosynthesis
MPRPLDIVVPVLNEEECIEEFYARIRRLGLSDALIFVDNASSDRTVELIERLADVRLVRHGRNEGYGASIVDGIAASDGERIVVIDADMEYPPEAIPALLEALEQHPCVYASRFLAAAPAAMPHLRRIGNRVVTGLFNRLFDQHTTDLYTGMKALRRDAFPLGALRRKGFEHVIELSVLVASSGQQIHDLPIVYTPRSRGISKMRHVPEALKFVAFTVWYWLRSKLAPAHAPRLS